MTRSSRGYGQCWKEPLIIGSFYRPPNAGQSNLEQLPTSLRDIQTKFKNAILLIAGNFNIADINWDDRIVKPCPTESSKCSLQLDICNEFFLYQMVKEFTQIQDATKHILDLVFTTHPNCVARCKVVADINSKPNINKKIPRKLFLFGKADIPSMKSDMIHFQQSFFNCDPLSHTVQENWDMLTSEIKVLVNQDDLLQT